MGPPSYIPACHFSHFDRSTRRAVLVCAAAGVISGYLHVGLGSAHRTSGGDRGGRLKGIFSGFAPKVLMRPGPALLRCRGGGPNHTTPKGAQCKGWKVCLECRFLAPTAGFGPPALMFTMVAFNPSSTCLRWLCDLSTCITSPYRNAARSACVMFILSSARASHRSGTCNKT